MLQAMQQTATTSLPPGSPTFAGLLAAFTAPAQKRRQPWDDDDVADDVVSLSYERALRAHSRYRAPGPTDRSLNQPVNTESLRIYEAFAGEAFQGKVLSSDADSADLVSPDREPTARAASAEHEYVSRPDTLVEGISTAPDRNLKSSSITIRLSRTECLQLRTRAGEAGLTVSAYLRSCTFEAESLRALVKDTLAKLRSETSAENQTASAPGGRTLRQRLARLWPLSRVGERAGERVGERTGQA
jgi:mobilization protein NikA